MEKADINRKTKEKKRESMTNNNSMFTGICLRSTKADIEPAMSGNETNKAKKADTTLRSALCRHFLPWMKRKKDKEREKRGESIQ